MRRALLILVLLAALPAAAEEGAALTVPGTVLAGVPFEVTVPGEGTVTLRVEGARVAAYLATGSPAFAESVEVAAGEGVQLVVDRAGPFRLRAGEAEAAVRSLPGWLSVLPPLVAIVLALVLRQVLLSLLAGIWLGAALLNGYHPLVGAMRTLDQFLVGALADEDHAYVLLFTLCLGGLIGIVARSGGMHGLVESLSVWARSARSSQVATWAMGLVIFFDDYANSLLVGNTMRPVTDRFHVSREKLSYIVDSTAAPVASIALISSWIGYELGLIQDSFAALGIQANVYTTFVESILYRYYAVFTIFFVLFVCWWNRDFGPMYRAERRARLERQVLRAGAVPLTDVELTELDLPDETPRRWWNAVVPIAVVIGLTLAALWYTGLQSLGGWEAAQRDTLLQTLGAIFGEASSFKALLWATAAGSAVAVAMVAWQGILSLERSLEAWLLGAKSVLLACFVLLLAWGIGSVCKQLYTAQYMVEATRTFLSPHLLPLVIFLVSAVVSFATGTSWGTMGIVMPLAIHVGHRLPADAGMAPELSWSILVGTIASVLAGSTFGDHCSPISDTTIMSSTASGSDHVDHVNTQAPYALVTAAIACLVGSLPGGWGVNPWLLNGIGIALCAAVIWFVGKPLPEPEP